MVPTTCRASRQHRLRQKQRPRHCLGARWATAFRPSTWRALPRWSVSSGSGPAVMLPASPTSRCTRRKPSANTRGRRLVLDRSLLAARSCRDERGPPVACSSAGRTSQYPATASAGKAADLGCDQSAACRNGCTVARLQRGWGYHLAGGGTTWREPFSVCTEQESDETLAAAATPVPRIRLQSCNLTCARPDQRQPEPGTRLHGCAVAEGEGVWAPASRFVERTQPRPRYPVSEWLQSCNRMAATSSHRNGVDSTRAPVHDGAAEYGVECCTPLAGAFACQEAGLARQQSP